MFPPRYISCDYCCYLRVPFHRLASPPGISRRTHPEGERCIYIHTEYCCRCCCCFVPGMLLYCSAATASCCRSSCAGWRKLFCWFIESDPFCFSSFKRFYVPLGSTTVVSHLRSRFAYILGDCGHARSQGGRQPAAAKPRWYIIYTRFLFGMWVM